MKYLIGSLTFFLGFTSVSALALSLSPNELPTNTSGPVIKRYYFQDEGKRLTFRIDGKMAVSGNSDSVAFRFDDLPAAAMKIVRSQMKPAIAFDEKNLPSYRATARALLAPEAINVEVAEEIPNAIAINGWTSHQFVLTYDLFGLHYRRSITFLNYSEKEQFIVDVVSGPEDYGKVYARGYRVLNSLSDTPLATAGPT